MGEQNSITFYTSNPTPCNRQHSTLIFITNILNTSTIITNYSPMRERKGKDLGKKSKCHTSYPDPIKMKPKSWIDALGRVSANSCLLMDPAECEKDHLQIQFKNSFRWSKSSSKHLQLKRATDFQINQTDLLATLTRGICVVYVQAMRDAARRANSERNSGQENIWSNPRAKIHLQVKNPRAGWSSGYFWK